MTAQELFANLSRILVEDEEMLASNERELLANVLQRARVRRPPENDEILQILAHAIGDTIAQRAVGKLGYNITQQILHDPSFVSGNRASAAESFPLKATAADATWPAGSIARERDMEALRGMGTPSVLPPATQPTGPRPPSPGPPSPGISRIEADLITHHMGTPSVPPPSPQPTGPRPPSPGPPSPGVIREGANLITHRMGTPSVPPPSPQPTGPRPPSPGPPSPGISRVEANAITHPMGTPSVPPPSPPSPEPAAPRPPSPGPPSTRIDQHSRFAAPRPPSPGPTPIAPSGPLPPSTGPRSAWVTEGSAARVAIARMPRILPAGCVLLDEFLMPSEVEELLTYALEREQQFAISEVITPGVRAGMVDYEHRRSRVLYDLGSPGSLLVNRVEECLPRILPRLEREAFPIARVEAQMTASNHGDFFHWHCDDGQEEVAKREITFVYFFHREPKEFEGGELRIYQSVRTPGGYIPGGEPQIIVPQQNQLVIFPSALAHEITPVECPSGSFGSSRFTVNGWFHR